MQLNSKGTQRMQNLIQLLNGYIRIEGLHDTVRTYMHTILPRCLVSFYVARYREKKQQQQQQQQKTLELLIYLTEWFKLSTRVCVLKFLSH